MTSFNANQPNIQADLENIDRQLEQNTEPPGGLEFEIKPLEQAELLAHLEEMLEIERDSFALPWSRESYELDILQNNHAHYVGALHQGRLVAYAGYWLIAEEGDINNVAVARAYRGRGIGTQLLQCLTDDCKGRGGQRLTLEVRQSNTAAIHLYEKFGFLSYGVRPHYYSNNGEGAVIMWLEQL